MTYKITNNPDGTYTVRSDKLSAVNITLQQLWSILSTVDRHITLKTNG